MKKLARKILGVVMVITLAIGLLPAMVEEVKAEELAEGALYVAGVDITTATDNIISSTTEGVNGGTAKLTYEDGTPVLTLSDFNYGGEGGIGEGVYAGICYTGTVRLIIRLNGTNEIKLNPPQSNITRGSYGIYCKDSLGTVVFESYDSGTLYVSSEKAWKYADNRTAILSNGTLIMKSGTITTDANTENASADYIGRGMYASTLYFYGGSIEATGCAKPSLRYSQGFLISSLRIQSGVSATVKRGANKEQAEVIEPNISSFNFDYEEGYAKFASISAVDYRDPLTYVDENGVEQTLTSYNIVSSSTTTWSSEWYVVKKDTTIKRNITGTGEGTVKIDNSDVNLLLCNGATLTITYETGSNISHVGIALPNDRTLKIFGQAGTAPGELCIANGERQSKGIGKDYNNKGGNIVVNGGKVTVTGGQWGCHITNLTVNRGFMSSTGQNSGAIMSTSTTVNGGKLVGYNTSSAGYGVSGTLTIADGLYFYAGDSEESAVYKEDTTYKAKYMRIDGTSPFTSLNDATVTIKKDGEALTAAPVVGDELTVACDATGVTYQWYRDGSAMTGKTSDSYTITADDVGKKFKVVATQKKDVGGAGKPNSDISKSSAETLAVVKKTPAAITVNTAREKSNINYKTETVNPASGYQISSTNSAYNAVSSITDILDGTNPKIYVRTAETNDTAAGNWVAVELTSRRDKPENLTAEKATDSSTVDGKIKVTSADMEYKIKDSTEDWKEASNDETVVKAGTYLVRYKATNDAPAGKSAELTVESKKIMLTKAQKPTAKEDLTYTGADQELVNAPKEALPAEYKMYYALGTATEATEPYTTSIPKATEVGTYYVWYQAKVVEGGDFIDSDPSRVKVTIFEGEPVEPEHPKLDTITKDTIKLKHVEGYEYSIDNGTSWQQNPEFTGLKENTDYTIQVREVGTTELTDEIYATTGKDNENTKNEEKSWDKLGDGHVRTETRVEEKAPIKDFTTGVNMNLANSIMTDGERAYVEGGKNCLIYFEAKIPNADEINAGKEAIDQKAKEKNSDATIGMFFDISIYKKIGDEVATKYRGEFPTVTSEIEIPEEMQSENRAFFIGVMHDDGDTENIPATKKENGTKAEFEFSRCSLFALCYVDTEDDSGNSANVANAGYVAKQRVDATKLMDLPAGVKIKYTSSDKKLAKVNRKGVIKIRKNAGTVTITAKNKKTGATISSCTLIIEKPVMKQKKLVVTGVNTGNSSSWQTRSANEFLGNTTVKPQWYSSKPSVAEVNKDTGEVTVKGTGKAKIYAIFGADAVNSKFGTRKVYKYKIVSKK